MTQPTEPHNRARDTREIIGVAPVVFEQIKAPTETKVAIYAGSKAMGKIIEPTDADKPTAGRPL